jgi:hypothetical protein
MALLYSRMAEGRGLHFAQSICWMSGRGGKNDPQGEKYGSLAAGYNLKKVRVINV